MLRYFRLSFFSILSLISIYNIWLKNLMTDSANFRARADLCDASLISTLEQKIDPWGNRYQKSVVFNSAGEKTTFYYSMGSDGQSKSGGFDYDDIRASTSDIDLATKNSNITWRYILSFSIGFLLSIFLSYLGVRSLLPKIAN